MKKRGLVTTLMGLLGLLFWVNPVEVDAETYAWAESDEGEFGWYQDYYEDRREIEGAPVFTDEDVLQIFAAPDEECAAFLSGLTGNVGTILVDTDAEVVIGTQGGGLQWIGVNVDEGTVTVYADAVTSNVFNGNLTVNGDMPWISLGSPNVGSQIGQGNVQVNGDVGSVTWYKQNDRDLVWNCFTGSVAVTGTVGSGTIMECLYDESIQQDTFQKIGEFGACENGVFAIESGSLSERVTVTEITPDLGDYRYLYQCYDWGADDEGNPANIWFRARYSNSTGEYAGDEPWNEADIPEGAKIDIYGTAQPVKLSFDIESLWISYGEIEIDGDVKRLVLNPRRTERYDVTVTGDVPYLSVDYRYNPNGNLFVGGTVEEANVWDVTTNTASTFACSNLQIIENGKWNSGLFFSTPQNGGAIGYQPIAEDVLQEALEGIGLGDEVTVGEQTLIKNAAVGMTQTEDSVVESIGQVEEFGAILNDMTEEANVESDKPMQASAVCAIDIEINSYYEDKTSGEIYVGDATYGTESVTELPEGKSLEFSVKIPKQFYDADATYSIVRGHESENGVQEWETLETQRDGDVLTFASDKFSTFVIVRVATANPFGDVKETDWFRPYVMFAYEHNLMGGKGETPDGSLKFDPANTITRAEFVQMLYSKENKPAVEYVDTFTDVPDDKWFTDAILWAAQEEIVGGKSATFFDVNGKITRQEIALILYKYALYKNYSVSEAENADLTGFADANSVSTWAATGMKWAVEYEVIGGKTVNGEQLLSPGGSAIRAEAATMMKAFMVAYEGISQ